MVTTTLPPLHAHPPAPPCPRCGAAPCDDHGAPHANARPAPRGSAPARRTREASGPRPDAPLADRAAAVFGREAGRLRWPYGLDLPNSPRQPTGEALARYEEAVADRLAAQESATAWAGSLGLKQSRSGCCPRWLQRRASRRCTPWSCTQYGGSGPDHDWLDRLTSWTYGGAPAAITSAPHQVTPEDEERLAWWARTEPRLRVARGAGWYGSGTVQLLVWRADLLGDDVRPA